MDLTLDEFAEAVGASDPVTISGVGSRGGPVPGVRAVRAPTGIESIDPAEMTVRCGAATPVDELEVALAEHGQRVAIPASGTVGGALAVGHSGIGRLGQGALRDVVLQIRYVSAGGDVVKAGGPTVKNVSGFDLCRLLVGSRGTLGFLGDVILRTRPIPRAQQWYTSDDDPWRLLVELYRPVSMLWNGSSTWVLLEGHPRDLASQAEALRLTVADGPPDLPTGGRWSIRPSDVAALRPEDGPFVAEVGVGVVHHHAPPPMPTPDAATRRLHERLKRELDPTGRLNPGVVIVPGGG